MLKIGQKVTVYEDPITKQKPEGQAEIIEHVESVDPGLDRYVVHFVGDPPGFHVMRLILDGDEREVHWVGGE